MQKNTLDDYRKAIKARYENNKENDATGYLYNPTPASLKQLCLLLLDSISKEDMESYKRFFNLRDESNTRRQIEHFDTDKFRPLRKFLLGEIDKPSQNKLDLLAVLVDMEPRPFRLFFKGEKNQGILRNDEEEDGKDVAAIDEQAVLNPDIADSRGDVALCVADVLHFEDFNNGSERHEVEEKKGFTNDKNYETEKTGTVSDSDVTINEEIIKKDFVSDKISQCGTELNKKCDGKENNAIDTFRDKKNKGIIFNRTYVKLFLVTLLVFAVYVAKATFFEEEGCMEWKGDHYEAVSCEAEIKRFTAAPIQHLDKETEALQKKIKVCDTTSFFLPNGKPCIWYSKMPDGTLEYFTYPGLHPVTGTTLKHITPYIIGKYVYGKR